MTSYEKIKAIYIYHINKLFFISPFTRKLCLPVNIIEDSNTEELIKVLDRIINKHICDYEEKVWHYIHEGKNLMEYPDKLCYALSLERDYIQVLKAMINKHGWFDDVWYTKYKNMNGIFTKDKNTGNYNIEQIVDYFLNVGKNIIEKKVEKKYDIPEKPGTTEAIKWLTDIDPDKAFGGNRFDTTFEGLKFVEKLYDLGAEYVEIIVDKNSPPLLNGDTLHVYLPKDIKKREKLFKTINRENTREGGDLETDNGQEYLTVWWD